MLEIHLKGCCKKNETWNLWPLLSLSLRKYKEYINSEMGFYGSDVFMAFTLFFPKTHSDPCTLIVLHLWTFRESVSSPKCLIFLRQHMVSGLRKSWVPSSDVYICTTQNCIDI